MMLKFWREAWVVSALAAGLFARSPAIAADAALIAAAKKEGRVVWYTTQQIGPLVRPVVEAFEKKYGIPVEYTRADSLEVTLRIINEGKAGRMQSDVFDGSAAASALKKQGMVSPWLPDGAKRLPSGYFDPAGYWVATNLFVNTAGVNTNLVAPGSEPKELNDLLDPKWKGRMVWNTTNTASGGPGMVGLALMEMGRDKGMDFLRALARQDISGSPVSARQILDQVIAGEYAMGLQIFNHAAVLSARQGAPVRWLAINPALVTLNVASLTAGGPHPNAGKLLLEFVTSREGQELYKNAAVLTVDPDVAPFDPALRPDGTRFRAIAVSPDDLDASLPAWGAIFREVFPLATHQ